MEKVHAILLFLHICAGSIGLIAGSINLIRRKSGLRHRQIGRVFTYAMLIAGGTAISLAWINPNPFLVIVGLFTIYLVGTGYRYILLRSKQEPRKPEVLDLMLIVGMALAGIVFIVLGSIHLFQGNLFGIVYLVFGSVGLLFVRGDIINYRGRSAIFNYWQTAHLQRMIGGYIASLTAFLVVNYNFFPNIIPGWLFWLLPSIILTPLIIIWSRKYGIVKEKR
jgi:uncharacterized membrane protein